MDNIIGGVDLDKVGAFINEYGLYILFFILVAIAIGIIVFIVKKTIYLVRLAKAGKKQEFRQKLFKYIGVLALIALGIYLLKVILFVGILMLMLPIFLSAGPVIHDNYYESNR